jgi:hypothetical protein
MWQDEIDDIDFQDELVPLKMDDRPDFFHQPITTYTKNILNALTGEDTGYKIGSKDEHRFFVVMDSDPNHYKEARRLFFTSPDAYENATGIEVPYQSKKRFLEKQKLFKYK